MHEKDETPSELSLAAVWAGLLSQKPARIRSIWSRLAASERAAVLSHLREMASGLGWQPGQREAAQSALEALHPPGNEAPPQS
jgi:hypothetical protein